MQRCNISGTLALCLAMTWAVTGPGLSADDARSQGRWIFRYDRSGEQPPAGRAQPDFLGVITERTETRARQWGMRIRVETLEGAQHSISVTQSTRVDGRPAKQAAEALVNGAAVAVFGEEVRGAFQASALFVIPAEDWREIMADARGVEDEEQRPPAAPPQVPPALEWPGEPEEDETAPSTFSWPARPWEPRYPIPEATAPAPRERPMTITPMERARRADFSGTIRGIRIGGRELSVATPGAVVVVLLDEQTAVRRDGAAIAPGDLREGDVVDVAVNRWRGSESCTAKQLWVVAHEEQERPVKEP